MFLEHFYTVSSSLPVKLPVRFLSTSGPSIPHSILTSEFLFYIYLLNKVHVFCNLFNWRFKPTLFCVLYFNMKKSACVLCQVCQTKESKITFVEEWSIFEHKLCKLKGQGVLNRAKFCVSSNCSHQCP